jgi:hypothetical protein
MKWILKISRDALKCSPKFTNKQADLYEQNSMPESKKISHIYKLQEMTLGSVENQWMLTVNKSKVLEKYNSTDLRKHAKLVTIQEP